MQRKRHWTQQTSPTKSLPAGAESIGEGENSVAELLRAAIKQAIGNEVPAPVFRRYAAPRKIFMRIVPTHL
eukprot:10976394-Lingulodinium_polyedra.AAC.1